MSEYDVDRRMKLRAQRPRFSFDEIEVFLFSGNSVCTQIQMTTLRPASEFPQSGKITLQPAMAQVLMDDLWTCGVRPTEGAGSAGAMAATEKHLEDMRKIAFGKLSEAK